MKKKVAIIGGGTAGLFLASFLDTGKFEVTIYDQKASLGRKFLVAGDGGFNLTHSEDLIDFKSRYTPPHFLSPALEAFTNKDLRAWLLKLGIPTFVGSSGRVFPEKGIKPIQVLKAIQGHLVEKGVQFSFNHTFTNWSEEYALQFNNEEIVQADYVVFALGGASWKVTGSDGSWYQIFNEKDIAMKPFKASNCAFRIAWNEEFIQRNEGTPLKNIAISIQDKTQKGEAVITQFGIEGNAIYALSPKIQECISNHQKARVFVDFKPMLDAKVVRSKLLDTQSNITRTLRDKLKLSRTVVDLIKCTLTKDEYLHTEKLTSYIKQFPLTIIDAAPIDEAISTSGGVSLEAIHSHFELKKIKNQFCIGEMLDWDAPTGGYLIQGCASMGFYLAQKLNKC